jgi:EamA-like transporter family
LSRRGAVLFAAMGVIWGIPYLLIKVADGGVSVPFLVWARVAVGALILVPVALAQGAWRPAHRAVLLRHWRWLVAYSVIEIIGPWALLSTAERHLSSSASGLLIASVPAIGALLAWLSGKRDGARPGSERLTAVRAAGLAAGFAGVVLLAGPGAGRAGRGVHGSRAGGLLLAHHGDRRRACHGRHVSQPGGSGRARRGNPRRAGDRCHRRLVRAHPRRIGARDAVPETDQRACRRAESNTAQRPGP